MKKRYLLCPQCGAHRFLIQDENGENIYFHVGWDQKPFPTVSSQADLTGRDFSRIHSCGCAWKGSISGLVKVLP